MIKGILLDYGGTIDTNGVHWARVFWKYYQQYKVEVSLADFEAAYVHGERALARNPLVKPNHKFEEVLQIKIGCQLDYLVEHGYPALADVKAALVASLAKSSNQFALSCIEKSKQTLDALSTEYPIVLVSNFYGNIQQVLDTYGLRHYFAAVVESAVVGVRKPDPAIFTLGAKALSLAPVACVVIGDSYTKDIAPGNTAGCKTIWLKAEGWGDDPEDVSLANAVITDFAAIPHALTSINAAIVNA